MYRKFFSPRQLLFQSATLLFVCVLTVMELKANPDNQISEPKIKPLKHNVKIIDLSWSNPCVDYYVKNLTDLEKNCPVDGLVIEVYGKKRMVNGKEFIPGSRSPMGKIAWKYEDFTDEIAKLKSVQSKKFTHNFFYTVPCPGNIDWLSDSDWAAITNNYGIAARIARETGMKGILFDLEQYGEKFWIPKYNTDDSFEHICKVARQRGREWGKAVFDAYPNIVIFGLTMFSSHCPTRMIRPFFNGILDVMPPTAILIDGHETEGYKANSAEDYDRMMCEKYRHFVKFAEPENRKTYYTQVKLAPAFYLDAIFMNRPGKWRDKYLNVKPGEYLLAFFRRNLFSAMRSGDDYIWLYGEHGCWSTPKSKFFTRWEKIAPGITKMVENMCNPEKIDVSKLTNLAGNHEFKNDLGAWSFWQIQEDKKGEALLGRGYAKDGILHLQGIIHGAMHQKISVKPYAIYLVRATMRHAKGSSGAMWLKIGYCDKKGNWLTWTDKSDAWEQFTSTNGEWIEMNQLIMIPADVITVSIHLGAGGMRPNDVVSFRDIYFCELPLR